MKRANKLYYRITCDANGEVMTVESSDKPSEEFVKLKDEHLEALDRPVCTKTMLESIGAIKTITGERRVREDADVQ
jgi:hypothetical protein